MEAVYLGEKILSQIKRPSWEARRINSQQRPPSKLESQRRPNQILAKR